MGLLDKFNVSFAFIFTNRQVFPHVQLCVAQWLMWSRAGCENNRKQLQKLQIFGHYGKLGTKRFQSRLASVSCGPQAMLEWKLQLG